MKKIQLKRLFFRLSPVRSSGTTVDSVLQGGLQSYHDYYSRKSSLWLDVRFESSLASVSLPGVTAGASCKGWMFLLANSSIINGNFQSFSSPTGILLLSAFLSLSSKSLARYLRFKPQGIEESHADFLSLTDTKFSFSQSKFVVFSQTHWNHFSASDASWMLLAGFLFLDWEKVEKVSQAWQQFLLKTLFRVKGHRVYLSQRSPHSRYFRLFSWDG